MSFVKRWWLAIRHDQASRLFLVPIFCAFGMIALVFAGGRYEREFRTNLEQGFQQRVELGDLASSLQQLRKVLEFPRVLDNSYIVLLVERVNEVERKAKAQNLAGRIGDLSLPTKELNALATYRQGFDRLAASSAQIERIQAYRSTLKPPELVDNSALKRLSVLLDDYASACATLRGSQGGQQSITQLASASLGLGENLQAAMTEARRKAAPQVWRDVLALFPTEPADFVDRLLADARLLEDFQAQRTKALGRLEQASAKIDSAERLLLGAKSDGGLLVVSTLLTWGGIGIGLMGLAWSLLKLRRNLRKETVNSEPVLDLVVPEPSLAKVEAVQSKIDAEQAERLMSERVAQAAGLMNEAGFSDRSEATLSESVQSDELTSGYWIASGSMAERRVALLDKQSVQLEMHVKSVLAAAESLAGRADMVVRSLQLVKEDQGQPELASSSELIRKRVDELQSLAINLSLQVAAGEVQEPVLDDLERFNRELEMLATEMKVLGTNRANATAERHVASTLEEGRRMIAAADTLKERAEILYEDTQRFRRHSEGLIRGIQEGAVSELPMRLVKDLRSHD